MKVRETKDAKEADKRLKAADQQRLASRVASEQAQQEKERRSVGAGAVARTFSVFNFAVEGFKDIPMTTEADLNASSNKPQNCSVPMIVTECNVFTSVCNNDAGFSTSHAKFVQDWTNSPQRRPEGSGRAARYVDTSVAPAALLDATVRIRPQSLKLKAELNESDLRSFECPWHFAYSPTMRTVGPEFSFMASVKHTFKGNRRVMMFPIDSLAKYFSETSPAGTICNLKKLSNLVTECCQDTANDMATRMPVYAAVLNPNSMLYTPAGFLVVEQVMNNGDVEGIRWVAMPTEDNAAPFGAMVKLLQQPLDGSAVPPNMQLMMKVHAVLSEPVTEKSALPAASQAKAVASPARAGAGVPASPAGAAAAAPAATAVELPAKAGAGAAKVPASPAGAAAEAPAATAVASPAKAGARTGIGPSA